MKQVMHLGNHQILGLHRVSPSQILLHTLPPGESESTTFAISLSILEPHKIEFKEIGGRKQSEDISLDTGLILEVIKKDCKISSREGRWRIEVTVSPKKHLIVSDAPSLFAAALTAYLELRKANVVEPHALIDSVADYLKTFLKDFDQWLKDPNTTPIS